MDQNNVCYLSEIYSAIQGEGPLVGVRQIFVRFSACDLRCVWCDTPGSLVRTSYCEVENASGLRKFQKIQNPIDSQQLISFLNLLSPDSHLYHSISLTGGEPLLQYKFLLSFLPLLKKKLSLPIYLESGGHRPYELKQIINYVDYVSMDFKLPSSAKTGILWDKHKEFLSISLEAKKNIWVKIVVTADTLLDELFYAADLVKSLDKKRKIEIFLQPVTEINGSKPPGEKEILDIQLKLLRIYPYIRVLPQVHKLIGQR